MPCLNHLDDVPVSFGLALTVIGGRRLRQVGAANARLKKLRANSGATHEEVILAEADLAQARSEYQRARRMDDFQARKTLAAEGVALCQR